MHAPEDYEENKANARLDIDKAVPILVQNMNIRPKELILDYGCGAGTTCNKYFVPIADKFDSQIQAVDISNEMVAYAKSNFPHQRVTFNVANIIADDFPFGPDTFDRIFSIYVLHYIKNYRAAIQKFWKILKPGGQLGFSVVARSGLFLTYPAVGEDPRFKPYMKGYEEFVPEWFEEKQCAVHAKECFTKAAENSGFIIRHMEIHHQIYDIKVDALTGLYLALNPFIKAIPEELHDELRSAYRKLVCKRCNAKEDAEFVNINYEMITAVLEKPSRN